MVDAHTDYFTFGENVHAPDCQMPDCGILWQPTRQPICLRHWQTRELPAGDKAAYTTVMNWSAARPLEYAGRQWGQKNVEFMRMIYLPEKVPEIPLAVAIAQTTGAVFPVERARKHGWRVLDPRHCAPNWESYRQFIYDSRGEFSVAKQTYVDAWTGWFSCRSACYLAAGRPVVTQDTGWTRHLPHGCGLLGFGNAEQAAEGLARIDTEPKRHAVRARHIAEEFFDSRVVLKQLLEKVGG
jgi:hypothetical protein